MKSIIVLLMILCMVIVKSNAQEQDLSVYKDLPGIPNYAILLKDLSEKQTQEIKAITAQTLKQLSQNYKKANLFDSLLIDKIKKEEDISAVKDSLQPLAAAILDIKIIHHQQVRKVLNTQQKAIFDKQYADFIKQSNSSAMPVVSINDIFLPTYKTKKNIIKSNMFSVGVKNYNVAFQRQITTRWAINISGTIMPATQTPFISQINNLIMGYERTDSDIERSVNNPLLNLETKGWSTNIGFRYFLPFKEYFTTRTVSGFYFGPFIHSNKYNYSTGFVGSLLGSDFNVSTEMTLKNSGLGCLFGNQWVINDKLVLDFTFLGLSYNTSSLNGTIKKESSGISIGQYVEEILDLNWSIFEEGDKNIISENHLDIKSSKGKVGILVALSIGYMF